MQPVPACARRSGCGRSSWVRALNPPPPGIQWLVTAVVWLGSAGVIVCLAIFGLLVPRLAAVRRIALAAVLTWAVCVLLGEILGPSAGRALRLALGSPLSLPSAKRSLTG